MSYKFNPFTGTLDDVGPNNGNGVPGGSDTQVQFNDGGVFGGDVDFTYNKTSNLLTLGGDINLNDGGSFTTTIQCVTPTANRTISFPDATGTVGLVAGSSGQITYNNAGAYAGLSTLTADGSGNVTLTGRWTNSTNGAQSLSPVQVTGAWYGTTGNNTPTATGSTAYPALYISPAGTSFGTDWSTGGTGFGVNAPASFGGNLLDLRVNGTSRWRLGATDATFSNASNGVNVTLPSGPGIQFAQSNDNNFLGGFNAVGLTVKSAGFIGWGTGSANNSSRDLLLERDAANTLAQRNGTNAQTFRVYNTFTDASNYERGFLRWSSNVFEVGPEAAGTGTARPMRITAATLKLPNLPTYADNAAATTGGLVAGDVYKTATGELRITV